MGDNRGLNEVTQLTFSNINICMGYSRNINNHIHPILSDICMGDNRRINGNIQLILRLITALVKWNS